MLTTFYPPYNFGGDGIYVHRLSNELASRGHKVDVVHCTDAYELLERRGPKGHYPNHDNVTVHRLRSKKGVLSPLLTQQTGRAYFKRKLIRKLIEETGHDVIHYHNMSLIGLESLEFGRSVKLYHSHDYWLLCPMHLLWKYNREPCLEPNCLPCQIKGRRPPQLWRHSGYMRKQLRHIDAFICPSRFTLQKYHDVGMEGELVHLPYFVPFDKDESCSEEAILSFPKRPYFLFVGRLEKTKGVQTLIPTFRRYPDCDLIIAGDGTYEDKLKSLAKDSLNIKFVSRRSYSQLRDLYRHARALIVPSIWYEVFGIVIIEAFAQKTPVIVSNQGGMPELVNQSGGGFIYRTEDELIDCLERLRRDDQLRDDLGRKGYRACQKYWAEDYHFDRYFQLIEEISLRKDEQHQPERLAYQS